MRKHIPSEAVRRVQGTYTLLAPPKAEEYDSQEGLWAPWSERDSPPTVWY